MAQITINIPDEYTQRVIDAICKKFDFDIYLLDNPSTTKVQFAKLQIIRFIKNIVINTETETARSTAETNITTEIQSIGIN